jgi:oligopeptidase B
MNGPASAADLPGLLPAVVLLGVVVGASRPATAGTAPPAPPVAPREPHVTELHGRRLVDDYHWLRERDDPAVLAYLEAENAYTEAVMAPTRDLQERLYQELLGRIQEDDATAPYRYGEFFYYSRTERGKPFPIHCRKRASLEAPEEVVLDLNALAAAGGHAFLELGNFEPSPDHRYLAYSYETSGDEVFTLVVKDLVTGELLPDRIENTYYSLAWASDGRTFFYTTLDATLRPYKVFRHRLGESVDVEVVHETDDRFHLEVERSRSGEVILATATSSLTSEVRWLPADQPETPFRVVSPREQGVEYYVDHRGEELWILTNREARNFRVMKAAMAATAAENWREVVPHRPEVRVEAMDVFRDRVVLVERADALSSFRVLPLDGGEEHVVPMPEPVYALFASVNMEFDAPVYRFGYNSLVTPKTIFDYRPSDRSLAIVKRNPVLGGYDPAAYATDRLWMTVADGTRVPISIAYRKGLVRDGRNPCLLTGYGAYGASYDPDFSPHWLTLLDRGFVFAIAHVRGGGEMGKPWHEAGRLATKRNTFTDFIAAAEYLIAEGWTAADRLAIRGTSAGGLLMGALTTMRPDLFAVVVARVPFVDVVNTMLDETLPLVAIEWEEWGDPREPEAFATMVSYSPYDNVQARDYPHLLVTAGLNDPRVLYHEPAKWVARLRALKTDDRTLLLKTNLGTGHSGSTDRYQALRERAFELAFVLTRLGLPG